MKNVIMDLLTLCSQLSFSVKICITLIAIVIILVCYSNDNLSDTSENDDIFVHTNELYLNERSKSAIDTNDFITNSKSQEYLTEITNTRSKQLKPTQVLDNYMWAWEPEETWNSHFDEVYQSRNFSERFPVADNCQQRFEPTVIDNAKKIDRYQFKIENQYLKRLCLDKDCLQNLLDKNFHTNREFPVIVTYSSQNHYGEAQEFFETIHKLYNMSEVKVIFYDLGLKPSERDAVKQFCKCEYRLFPFKDFPDHVAQMYSYAWKPVILQLVLMEYDLVMWADTSIRFFETNIGRHITDAKNIGVQFLNGDGHVSQRTSEKTFKFLHETPCLYRDVEVQAGFGLISRNPFSMKYIVKPWVMCALQYNCMVFKGSIFTRGCVLDKDYFQCHRYDQSVMGILLTRLFNAKRDFVNFYQPTFAKIMWDSESNYFDKLQSGVKNL